MGGKWAGAEDARTHGERRDAPGRDVEGGELVQWDDDVRPELLLGQNRALGREVDELAVPVGSEDHAPLRDLEFARLVPLGRVLSVQLVRHGVVREGEDLETARVRDQGLVPVHEFVEAAGLGDDLGPGLQQEVVAVAEHELLPAVARRAGVEVRRQVVHVLERRIGRDRDVSRRVDVAVGGVNSTHASRRPRLRGPVDDLEAEKVPGLPLLKRRRRRRRPLRVEPLPDVVLLADGRVERGRGRPPLRPRPGVSKRPPHEGRDGSAHQHTPPRLLDGSFAPPQSWLILSRNDPPAALIALSDRAVRPAG